VAVAERVDGKKVRYGPAEALALLRGVTRLVAARGKKVTVFDLNKDKPDKPDEQTLLAHLIGPTGNLRAPAMKVGTTFVVGFNPEAYRSVL
jgi:hypothetical protein